MTSTRRSADWHRLSKGDVKWSNPWSPKDVSRTSENDPGTIARKLNELEAQGSRLTQVTSFSVPPSNGSGLYCLLEHALNAPSNA